jgi:hypothetical protein
MAFIKSGGTLFPTLPQRAIANFIERRFLGACLFPAADSLAQVLQIQLPRTAPADYNDSKFKSLLLQCA